MRTTPLTLFLLALALLTAASCGDPCRSLSERICRCERNTNAQNACVQRVATLAGMRPNDPNSAVEQAGRNQCSQLMGTCTCDALAQGNLKACGLSLE